jgi:hypothetical protein
MIGVSLGVFADLCSGELVGASNSSKMQQRAGVAGGTEEEKLQGIRNAEFLRLRKLNENRSKTDQEVWDMVA